MTQISLQNVKKTLRVEPFAGETLLLAFRDDCGSLSLSCAGSFVQALRENRPGVFKDRSTHGLTASIRLTPVGDGCDLTMETLGRQRVLHLNVSDRQNMADVIGLLLGLEQPAPAGHHA